MNCTIRVGWAGPVKFMQRVRSRSLSLYIPLFQTLKDIEIKDPDDEKGKLQAHRIRRTLWFLGVARNAVVVLVAATIAYFVHQDQSTPLILTGK